VAESIDAWRAAIDRAYAAGLTGPQAIGAAVDLMDRFVRELETERDKVQNLASRLERESAAVDANDACGAATRVVYDTARLVSPRTRVQHLVALASVVTTLRARLLARYGDAAAWTDADYRLGAVAQPKDEATTLVIRATAIGFAVDRTSGALLGEPEIHRSTTLTIRKYSRLAREFAAGTVLSTVTMPVYATSRNAAGEMIVVRARRDRVSMTPGMLVSFVCRCQTGPFVAPMLQFGITTSRDVPALMIGGGIRLFSAGPGEVALGAGVLVGWVKYLRAIQEGDIILGTRDIEAALRAIRKQGPYLALQYKF
jgi:hypothetical protein